MTSREGKVLVLVLVAGLMLSACGNKLSTTIENVTDIQRCPPGTELADVAPPFGNEQWCQRMDENRKYIKDGPYTKWYLNGQKQEEGGYKNGKQEGHWITRYESGQKDEEGEYKDGQKEGLWTLWYENGQKDAEGEYRNGKHEGPWTQWHPNGQKQMEFVCKDDTPEGRSTEWYENGQKSSESEERNGKLEGHWTGWHENGQKREEGEFRDGNKEGRWIEWDPNGQKMSEGEFKDGNKEGRWTEWHSNGQKAKEGKYKDGMEQGRWTEWSPNGQKQQTEFRDGNPKHSPSMDIWKDSQSGLTWQVSPTDGSMYWSEAKSHCKSLSLGGYSGWRLPTINELRSLIRGCPATQDGGPCGVTDSCRKKKCWNDSCNGCSDKSGYGQCVGYGPPKLSGNCYWYWSSSVVPGYDEDVAWAVDFSSGRLHGYNWAYPNLTRCVR